MPQQIAVFDPTAPFRSDGLTKRLLPDSLNGKVVGFIDNSKPNFRLLADDMAEALVAHHGVASVIRHVKRAASIPAPEEAMQDVVANCDIVIAGSGD